MTPPILHCVACNTRLTHIRNGTANGSWINHYRCPDCRRSGHTRHQSINEPIQQRRGPAVDPDHNTGAATTHHGDTLPVPDGGHEYVVIKPEIVAGFNDRKQADKFADKWSDRHDEPHIVARSNATVSIDAQPPEEEVPR